MFSLGNKEAIVNSSAKYPVTFATIDSAEDKIKIEGFGSFKEDQLVSATCQRFKASRLDGLTFTAPTATELGIASGTNVPVTLSIRMKTFRDQSEWATNYILNGRPIVFEILVTAAETSANIGVKIVAAFDEWIAKFNYADNGLPFTYADVSGVITMISKDYSLFFQNRVEFKVDREVTPIAAVSTKMIYSSVDQVGAVAGLIVTLTAATHAMVVGDVVSPDGGTTLTTVTAVTNATPSITVANVTGFDADDEIDLKTTALDPTFDGKYLEENARMSLSTTSDSYGISPDEKPYIAGQYASIEFVVNDANVGGIDGQYAKHSFLGNTRGEIGGTRQFKFTLYMLESADMWTGSAGNKVFDIVDWLDDSSISPVLLLGTGEVAADAAAWVA